MLIFGWYRFGLADRSLENVSTPRSVYSDVLVVWNLFWRKLYLDGTIFSCNTIQVYNLQTSLCYHGNEIFPRDFWITSALTVTTSLPCACSNPKINLTSDATVSSSECTLFTSWSNLLLISSNWFLLITKLSECVSRIVECGKHWLSVRTSTTSSAATTGSWCNEDRKACARDWSVAWGGEGLLV